MSSEGIAIGGKTSPGTERNARTSKCKSPGKTEASTKKSTSHDQSQGPHPQKHELLMTKGRSGTPKVTRDPMEVQASYEGWGVGNRAGKSVLMAQVESSVSACISGQDQDDAPQERTAGSLPATGKDDQKTRYSASTCTSQATEERIAEWKEAASAQAVKRGHTVTMIEVPDAEDDTAFRQWQKRGSPIASPKRSTTTLPTPPESPTKTTSPLPNEGVGPTCITKNEVTSPTVAMPSAASAKVQEAPHRWMRPFKVDWTLRVVCEARNDTPPAPPLRYGFIKTRVQK